MASLFYSYSMNQHGHHDQIPEQQTGAQSNTEALEVCTSEAEAASFFEVVKARLIDVNSWHHYAGALTADFKLCDAHGVEVKRDVQEGDHFKIDIPGPGPATGDGYDWVQVESIEELNDPAEDSLTITVRPATNPNNRNSDVAHFFSEEATSCFMVTRSGKEVKAAVYGRNEKPNTHTEKAIDKVRNTAVASGAVSGFSKLQWKSLVTGLVKR
jgi:hypothetical protein